MIHSSDIYIGQLVEANQHIVEEATGDRPARTLANPGDILEVRRTVEVDIGRFEVRVAHLSMNAFKLIEEEVKENSFAIKLSEINKVKSGVDLISEERKKQLKEYTPIHDDEHTDCAIAITALYLIAHNLEYVSVEDELYEDTGVYNSDWGLPKKHEDDRIKQLTIAGALIAAEIDRLNRKEEYEKDKASRS